jgi:hypothetical protein
MSKKTHHIRHIELKTTRRQKILLQHYHYTDIEYVKTILIFLFHRGEDIPESLRVFYPIRFNYISRSNTAVFNDIISEAKQRSLYIISDEVKDGDKILTLSTCSAYYNKSDPDNYRLVVMARLVGANESTPATMEVTANPNPKKS